MIKNYNLASRNFASDKNFAPIKAFRKRTAHSREIFESFAETGKRIVHLKKQEEKGTLSTKAEAALKKLQEKSERIVQKIDEIMKNSDYSARDVLSAGYPMLATGKYADWIFGSNNEDEDDEELKALMNDNSEEEEDKEETNGQRSKTNVPAISPQLKETIEELSEDDEKSLQTILDDAEDEIEEVKKEAEPLIKLTEWEQIDQSMWGSVKRTAVGAINGIASLWRTEGALAEFWETFKDIMGMANDLLGFWLLQFMTEELKYAADIVAKYPIAEISKVCAESATEGYATKGAIGKLRLSTQFKRFFRKYLTPAMIRLTQVLDTKILSKIGMKVGGKVGPKISAQYLLRLAGKLSGAINGAMKVEFAAWLFEEFCHSGYEMYNEYQNSKAQIEAIKNCVKIVMKQSGKAFKYLDFDISFDTVIKDGENLMLGAKSFMSYCQGYAPLASYFSKDNKALGLLYVAVYDPSAYKAGGEQLEKDMLPEHLQSALTQHQRTNDANNIITLWLVPEQGDEQMLLMARNALPILPYWFMMLYEHAADNNKPLQYNFNKEKDTVREDSEIVLIQDVLEKYAYLLDCDKNGLSDTAIRKLEGASIFKALGGKAYLTIVYLGQLLVNWFSNLVRSVSDSDAYNEGRTEFYVTGTMDPFQALAAPFSQETRQHIIDSWTPVFTGGKRVEKKKDDKERQNPALPAKSSDQ